MASYESGNGVHVAKKCSPSSQQKLGGSFEAIYLGPWRRHALVRK